MYIMVEDTIKVKNIFFLDSTKKVDLLFFEEMKNMDIEEMINMSNFFKNNDIHLEVNATPRDSFNFFTKTISKMENHKGVIFLDFIRTAVLCMPSRL